MVPWAPAFAGVTFFWVRSVRILAQAARPGADHRGFAEGAAFSAASARARLSTSVNAAETGHSALAIRFARAGISLPVWRTRPERRSPRSTSIRADSLEQTRSPRVAARALA